MNQPGVVTTPAPAPLQSDFAVQCVPLDIRVGAELEEQAGLGPAARLRRLMHVRRPWWEHR